MRLTFLGAAGTVTGSKFLVESPGGARVLVDCGLYQGVKQLRLRNWQPLPVDAASLDAVVLTHAHLDHSGYLPALVRAGFEGPIHCTPPTRDLCEILLPDSGRIQEEDARYANRKRFSKHDPALPLYTEEEATRVFDQIEEVDFGEERAVADLRFRLTPAGHILGAASALVSGDGGAVLFSGDLGRDDDLLMRPPQPPAGADWIVMESTYGDRSHGDADPIEALAEVAKRTAARGGVVLIPSFAVGRAQTLLLCLHELFRRELAPDLRVYVNSPMATDVTRLYQRHAAYHRLSRGRCAEVFGAATFTRSVEESKELAAQRFPAVILSASGMATGGRVLHHLKALAPDHRNTILLPGFQAPGTRGASLAAGDATVKIHGRHVPVRAEVVTLDVFSAHADRDGLLGWLSRASPMPRRVFLVHGEPVPADTLRRCVEETLGVPACVPEWRESVELAG